MIVRQSLRIMRCPSNLLACRCRCQCCVEVESKLAPSVNTAQDLSQATTYEAMTTFDSSQQTVLALNIALW